MKNEMNKGFIGWLVLLFIALVLLKYFLNWDIFDAAGSDQGQSTMGYAREIINRTWDYIETPVTFAWERVIWPILSLAWDSFQAFLDWGNESAERGVEPIRY